MRRNVIGIFGILLIVLVCFIYFRKSINNKILKVDDDELFVKNEIIETSYEEDKISVNTKIYVSTLYGICGHSNLKEMEVTDEIINMKQEEAEEFFKEKGYSINKFSIDHIELESKKNQMCLEHFVIKFEDENDKFVSVYRLDENNELNLYKDTDIAKEFLTSIDNQKLEEGIEVYGLDNVEVVLEDFE